MSAILPIVGAFAGLGAGYFAGAKQHLLYRQPAFREQPATGRSALVIRVALGLAAALAVALAFRPDHYNFGPALLTAAFSVALLVLASTDLERRLLPNRLMYPVMVAAVAVCWAWPDRTVTDIALGAGAAAAAGAAIFALGVLLGGPIGGIGLGDIKLIVLVGMLVGWPAVLSALLLGVLLGGVPALILVARRRGRSYFSYGPYLIAGALVVLLFPSPFV